MPAAWLLLFCLLLSACGGERERQQLPLPEEEEEEVIIEEPEAVSYPPVTIRFAYQAKNAEEADLLEALTSAFNDSNTQNVTVETIRADAEPDFSDADLLLLEARELAGMRGRIVPFREELTQSLPSYAQLNPSLCGMFRMNGEILAVPLAGEAEVFFCHTALLEETGVTGVPADWDAVLREGRKLREEKRLPLIGITDRTALLELLLAQNDCAYLADEGILFDNAAGRSVLKLLLTLFREEIVAVYEDEEALVKAFQDKKTVGMFLNASSEVRYELSETAVSVSTLPVAQTRAFSTAGRGIALLTSDPEEQRGALAFLSYLTEPEQNANYAIGTGRLPAVNSVYELPSYRNFLAADTALDTASSAADAFFFTARSERQEEMHGRLAQALEEALPGEADAEEVIQTLRTAVHGGEE
ncbi:MAG: extracellular solute-binding protein [Lachnospiraceae bacterium]|nr:extracellular solute-binding protein [Lachnospiraceae bacterium]